jgi:hypothetical protein
MLARSLEWARQHRRMLALKLAVALALVVAHYYPQTQFGLYVNLLWLILF